MELLWYHLGDSTCLAKGHRGFVTDLVDNPAGPSVLDEPLQDDDLVALSVDDRLRELFKPLNLGHGTGQDAPLLRWIRRVVAPRTDYPWLPSAMKGLDVRVVWGMPPGYERELLLTPSTLYVSWGFFAGAKRKRTRLGRHLRRLGVSVPKLPDDATSGHHMWVDATLDAGDAMAKCRPGDIPSDPQAALHVLGVMAEIREQNNWRSIRNCHPNAVGPWPGDVTNATAMEIGEFRVEKDGRPRDQSFVRIENDSITLVLGTTEDNVIAYCPWPCGGFTGC